MVAYAPYINGQALIARGKGVSGVLVRGVLPERERQVSEVTAKLIEGRSSPQPASLASSSVMASPGSSTSSSARRCRLVVPQAQASPAGAAAALQRFTWSEFFRPTCTSTTAVWC